MRKLMAMVSIVAGLLAVPRAYAHEGGVDARGVVKTITGQEIVVTTTAGADLTVAIVPGTEVVRGKESIHAQDVHPGERVVVHAMHHDGRLEAKLIKVAGEKKT
jgi:hypothetical protein